MVWCAALVVALELPVACQPASAAPAPPVSPVADGRAAAIAMAKLFAETCLRHAGDAAGLRATLGAALGATLRTPLAPPRYRPIAPGIAQAILHKPGLAFELPGSPGHLMVLSFDDGWCGIGGTGIDPNALTLALSHAVGAGGVIRLMGADPGGREQRYLIRRPHHRPVALLVLLMPADGAEPGQTGGPALVQASLFASEMGTGEGEAR